MGNERGSSFVYKKSFHVYFRQSYQEEMVEITWVSRGTTERRGPASQGLLSIQHLHMLNNNAFSTSALLPFGDAQFFAAHFLW
jgi:hypothetical protein